MKKLSTLLVIVIVLLTLTACGEKPEKNAMAFLDAVAANDFETAKLYTTDEGTQLLTMAASMQGAMGGGEEEDVSFRFIETTVKGDSAFVKYGLDIPEEADEDQVNELPMVKVDGEWKVALTKDNARK